MAFFHKLDDSAIGIADKTLPGRDIPFPFGADMPDDVKAQSERDRNLFLLAQLWNKNLNDPAFDKIQKIDIGQNPVNHMVFAEMVMSNGRKVTWFSNIDGHELIGEDQRFFLSSNSQDRSNTMANLPKFDSSYAEAWIEAALIRTGMDENSTRQLQLIGKPEHKERLWAAAQMHQPAVAVDFEPAEDSWARRDVARRINTRDTQYSSDVLLEKAKLLEVSVDPLDKSAAAALDVIAKSFRDGSSTLPAADMLKIAAHWNNADRGTQNDCIKHWAEHSGLALTDDMKAIIAAGEEKIGTDNDRALKNQAWFTEEANHVYDGKDPDNLAGFLRDMRDTNRLSLAEKTAFIETYDHDHGPDAAVRTVAVTLGYLDKDAPPTPTGELIRSIRLCNDIELDAGIDAALGNAVTRLLDAGKFNLADKLEVVRDDLRAGSTMSYGEQYRLAGLSNNIEYAPGNFFSYWEKCAERDLGTTLVKNIDDYKTAGRIDPGVSNLLMKEITARDPARKKNVSEHDQLVRDTLVHIGQSFDDGTSHMDAEDQREFAKLYKKHGLFDKEDRKGNITEGALSLWSEKTGKVIAEELSKKPTVSAAPKAPSAPQ